MVNSMDPDKAMEKEFGGKKIEAACPFRNGNLVFPYMQLSQGQIVRCQHCDKEGPYRFGVAFSGT